MRCVFRILRTLCACTSLLIAMAVLVLWFRTAMFTETFRYEYVRPHSSDQTYDCLFVSARSGEGRMYVAISTFGATIYDPTRLGSRHEYYRMADESRIGPFWKRHFGFEHVWHDARTQDWIVAAPHWALLLVTLLPAVPSMVRRLRPRRDPLVVACPSCGYDLRATPGRCPECGMVVPIDPRRGANCA